MVKSQSPIDGFCLRHNLKISTHLTFDRDEECVLSKDRSNIGNDRYRFFYQAGKLCLAAVHVPKNRWKVLYELSAAVVWQGDALLLPPYGELVSDFRLTGIPLECQERAIDFVGFERLASVRRRKRTRPRAADEFLYQSLAEDFASNGRLGGWLWAKRAYLLEPFCKAREHRSIRSQTLTNSYLI